MMWQVPSVGATGNLVGGPMPAQLVSLGEGPSILLDKPILLIGRHPECDIQIDSRKISRRHCCIAQVSDYLVVRDLGSTNGIRINGVRLLEGRLKAGDELTIGGNRYRISWDMLPVGSVRSRLIPAKTENSSGARSRKSAEDALLEAAEEPVALAEGTPEAAPVPYPSGHRAAASPIVPENLGLAPSDLEG